MDYKGMASLPLNDEQLALYYQEELNPEQFVNVAENEYLFITHNGEPLANEVYKKRNGALQKIKYQNIHNHWAKANIKPIDPYQAAAVDLLLDEQTTIKVVRGVYGSGQRI